MGSDNTRILDVEVVSDPVNPHTFARERTDEEIAAESASLVAQFNELRESMAPRYGVEEDAELFEDTLASFTHIQRTLALDPLQTRLREVCDEAVAYYGVGFSSDFIVSRLMPLATDAARGDDAP
jgi:hypothetical protein